MKRLILVGSPRTQGRSATLGNILFETHIAERPQDELFLVPISEIEVGPCIGCDGCKELSTVVVVTPEGNEEQLQRHRCIYDDDMQTLYDLVDEADEITCVVPVYFSGCPAPFKCLLDRLQPYFWSDARKHKKRPLTLHIVGEGGDPHGFGPLVGEVRSAFSVAGFAIEKVLNWVGKISPEGEILEEATEVNMDDTLPNCSEGTESSKPKKPRPKLKLS